jgi:aspartate oxidase
MSEQLLTDFLVLGSGVAGLRAAIGLARYGSVLVVTKDQPTESNTGYAQGGVAVALGADDEPRLHLEDTIAAGAGIVSRAAAEILVSEGPPRSGGCDRVGDRSNAPRESPQDSRNRGAVVHLLHELDRGRRSGRRLPLSE